MTPATLFCGRYLVVRRLGSGGTATVFLAEDQRSGRKVAVKRLHGVEVTEVTAERLRREARIMASLHHPNLVTVLDMLTEDDDLYLVMEYVPGRHARRRARGGAAGAGARARAAAARRRRARPRARERRGAPRRQALQRPRRRPRRGQARRPGARDRGRDHADHAAGLDPRHSGVHGARAGAARALHARDRHLRAGDDRLPGAERHAAADGLDRHGGPAAGREHAAARPARAAARDARRRPPRR